MLGILIVCVGIFVLLVLVAAIQPERTQLSGFEMKRRVQKGDTAAKEVMQREHLLADVESIQRAVSALLLVIFVGFAIFGFGWIFGIILSFIVALQYGTVSRISLVRQFARGLYGRYEAPLLRVVERYEAVIKFFRNSHDLQPLPCVVHSRDELAHMVENAGTMLSGGEKKRIITSLSFDTRAVKEVMTPRTMITSIKEDELLGPLVLDSLHKSGHSRFPVVREDLDHIVGMLYVHDLLTLSNKASSHVKDAMEPRVFFVREDQTLAQALAAFLKTRHHLFVVINEFRETVGLLSLEDVIEALLGYKIVDEFDVHDDLRLVAARSPKANKPQSGKDI